MVTCASCILFLLLIICVWHSLRDGVLDCGPASKPTLDEGTDANHEEAHPERDDAATGNQHFGVAFCVAWD